MSEVKAGGFLLSGLCHKLKVRRMTMTRQNQFDPLCNQFVLLCNVDLAIIRRVLHSFLPSSDDVGGRRRMDVYMLGDYVWVQLDCDLITSCDMAVKELTIWFVLLCLTSKLV